MKPSPISVAILVVSLLLAPTLSAQSPGSANQSTVSPAASAVEVPRLIKFSGALLDAQDRPLAGPVGVTFALHAQQTGGATLWLETQNVTPDAHGSYTVLLGANSTNGVPAELFASGEARWLEVQVERQAEQPRILLVSVPYALKAKDAETLGGKPASAFLTTETLSGSSATTTAAASTALPSAKAQATLKKAASTPQPATACANVSSDGTAAVNSLALFTAACKIQSSLMTQTVVNGFPGVNLAGNNAGLLLSGTGTHEVTVTGSTSSGRLGQDSQGFFFASDTPGKVIKFDTNNNGTLTEWMRITSAGNVGIGAATPGAKLEIAGGNLALPNTTSGGTAGVLTLGGLQFAHNFGQGNTFLGARAGNFTMIGIQNTASGAAALQNNTSGTDNTASGWSALQANTTGSANTAAGFIALTFNTTGSNNTASGQAALEHNTSGADNTASGAAALQFNTTGSNNTALGVQAGRTANSNNANITGSNNTFIGFNSGPGTTTQLTNATAIGENALVFCSNCMALGGTGADAVNVGIGTTAPVATLEVNGDFAIDAVGGPGGHFLVQNSGAVGIGTTAPDNLLTVNGTADKPGGGFWGTFSDARLKTVDGAFHGGLHQVLKLNPIVYRYKGENALGIKDNEEHVGLVAQEVEKVIPEAVSKNAQGYRIVNDDPILWAMLNAIKEQEGQIKQQQGEIRALKARLAQLEAVQHPARPR